MRLPASHDHPSVDRRAAVKRLATAGAVAWTVPTVLSSRAVAQGDACTPGCAPQIESGLTATLGVNCSGAGSGRDVRLTLTLSGNIGATCPCDANAAANLGPLSVTSTVGSASISGNIVTVDLGRGSTSQPNVTVFRPASCDDNTACQVNCGTTFVVTVAVGNQGNCRAVSASLQSTIPSC